MIINMFNLLAFILGGLLISISTVLVQTDQEKQHIYVKPSPTSSGCPQDEVCMTLSDYLQSVSNYFTSNTTIHLLPGNHTISEPSYSLLVSNVSNLSLTGRAGDTTLYCTERFGLAFVNATNLSISGIDIINCGRKVGYLLKDIDLMGFKMPVNVKAALALVNVHSLVLQNIRIEASYGYGLLGVSVLGDSTVTNCTFTHNMWRSDDDDISSAENKPGGNVLLVFPLHINKDVLGSLHITQCEFAYGIDTATLDFETWTGQSVISGGSGLGILLYMNRKDYFDSFIFSMRQQPSDINIDIRDSTFHHNSAPNGAGANLLFLFHNYVVPQKVPNSVSSSFLSVLEIVRPIDLSSTLHINNCSFHDGSALKGGGIFVGSANIGGTAKTIVKLLNSHIFDNVAESTGGGLCIISKAARILEGIKKVQEFLTDNCTFSNNKATHGGAVHIATLVQWEEILSIKHVLQLIFSLFKVTELVKAPLKELTTSINISQTHFFQNTARGSGGGMDVSLYTTQDPLRVSAGSVLIVCTDCSFIENEAESGFAASVRGCGKINNRGSDKVMAACSQTYRTTVKFANAKMKHNGVYKYNRNHSISVLYLSNTEEIILSDSTIYENNGSAVYVIGSQLLIAGEVEIVDNHGISGGGLYFDCNPRSFLYLTPHSKLYMANNTASLHGGAIAAQDCSALGNDECFVQLQLDNYNCSLSGNATVTERIKCYDTQVTMENNKAMVAGDSIYSSSFEKCYLKLGGDGHKLDSNIFQSLFKIHNTQSLSEVTSDPFQVCFCDRINVSECVTETQVEVYPGQAFHIPAVGVGQFNNASPAVIRTTTSTETEQLLGEGQSVQELGRDCGLLTYIVKSFEHLTLQLSVEKASHINTPATVSVIIMGCPPGFENDNDLSVCDCELHLKKRGIKCDIDSQTFHQPGSMWIGHYGEEQVTVHTDCPFHYCKSEDNEFTLDNQDYQCAFNHSGVLCGACQRGLSLALGTSQCLKCSNVYLLLLIPFALAGVALVFLLLKCNLTVSVGSINGLIFYVNIIQVNHTTFFPQGVRNMILLTKCLSVFIAWLNLDLGIQTCFFTGMTAYTKTWLQFVFPAYVWIMVGVMIYGSRHFPTVSRVIGSNAVQVLATLFLLSYAKLLRTAIAAAYSTALIGRDSSTPLVWLLDGNVPFFRGTHIVLLLMALVVILVYIIPFTVLVLLAPCLQANSNQRLLRLVNIKLKPLLDAYQGPYKDKFRYWTGLMLLSRVILSVVFAGNVLGKPEINLFAVIIIVVLLVIFVGRRYKNLVWNTVESFYLLNLVGLAAATFLLRSIEERSSSTAQEIITDISVGAAFAVFCSIVLYHFCVYLLKISWTEMKLGVQRLLRRRYWNQEPPRVTITASSNYILGADAHTVSHLELNYLREPLLSV